MGEIYNDSQFRAALHGRVKFCKVCTQLAFICRVRLQHSDFCTGTATAEQQKCFSSPYLMSLRHEFCRQRHERCAGSFKMRHSTGTHKRWQRSCIIGARVIFACSQNENFSSVPLATFTKRQICQYYKLRCWTVFETATMLSSKGLWYGAYLTSYMFELILGTVECSRCNPT